MRSGMKKNLGTIRKKANRRLFVAAVYDRLFLGCRCALSRLCPCACQCQRPMSTFMAMKILVLVVLSAFLSASSWAQAPNDKSDAAQLEAINKKLDLQNAKIDALSQQILKLQEQVSKPGVPIGEASPPPAHSTPTPVEAMTGSGNTHTVLRGETLTSIAKQYKVGVDELQRFNHIEDGRKLQAGQTIMIPTPGAASPAASAEPSLVPND